MQKFYTSLSAFSNILQDNCRVRRDPVQLPPTSCSRGRLIQKPLQVHVGDILGHELSYLELCAYSVKVNFLSFVWMGILCHRFRIGGCLRWGWLVLLGRWWVKGGQGSYFSSGMMGCSGARLCGRNVVSVLLIFAVSTSSSSELE
eukprot:snap_masked-scaffold_3-processed-gene-8.38-mRNA-1 protein AED:1.00 eAED:1.00 QI:0/0/0/0/1/1/2/0/144